MKIKIYHIGQIEHIVFFASIVSFARKKTTKDTEVAQRRTRRFLFLCVLLRGNSSFNLIINH